MIYYLVTDRFSFTIKRLLREAPELRDVLCWLTYEELFFERSGPVGHYIFTDIDRLSRYEREAAARFAAALRRSEPQARQLNSPSHSLDRVPLLAALNFAGINDFVAERLDTGARPSRFPVFIRTEDGHRGPETDLLHDAAEFDAALAEIHAHGKPLRGRIAVGYAGQRGADGKFRRYSAYRIGERVFVDELFIGEDWAVKDAVALWSPEAAIEEVALVRANPHHDVLTRAFAIGNIDFGRMDYGTVDGRVQVYEINTNPTFAIRLIRDNRLERRLLFREMLVGAVRALDTPLGGGGRVKFSLPKPRAHSLHLPPASRLAKSLLRRIGDSLSGRQE